MLSAVKQKSLQLFSEHVQRNVRRSQFSWQTVPNYRAMYSKATAAVGCPCTWHNDLAGCGGSQGDRLNSMKKEQFVSCADRAKQYQSGTLHADDGQRSVTTVHTAVM